ncbi:hypothetical protein ACIA98_37950 [Streptomyces sp. NPDC051366]|uniref:hypothetical protein n=1 Tax=Streptomyces sp. NPDC051366 TaxID=3365652 RepID=UPI0037B003C7
MLLQAPATAQLILPSVFTAYGDAVDPTVLGLYVLFPASVSASRNVRSTNAFGVCGTSALETP